MSDNILVEQDAGIVILTFNRPERLNALIPGMVVELTNHIRRMSADPAVRAVILTGVGDAFSSGGDLEFLKQFQTMNALAVGRTVYSVFGAAVEAIKHSPKPFVAAVNGVAVGAAFDLALACDFRIGSDTAMFCESWANIGIIPALGGLYLLPRIVGLGRATEIIMRGRKVYAEEAERIGLITKRLPAIELMDEARSLAQELSRHASVSNEFIKLGLERGFGSSLAAEWEWARHVQASLISSGMMDEGINAILERRQPDYSLVESSDQDFWS